MAQSGWTQQIGEYSIRVVPTRPEAEGSATPDRYRLEIVAPEDEFHGVPLSPGVTVEFEPRTGGDEAIVWRVTVPEELSVARFRMRRGDESQVVLLPGPQVLAGREKILTGETEDVGSLLSQFDTPIEMALCGCTGLAVEDFLSTIETVCRADRYAASRIHAYRYAILRGAITPSGGFSVSEPSEISRLVSGLDSIEEVGSLDLADGLGELLATGRSSIEDVTALAGSVGVDIEARETPAARRLYAGILATLADTVDIRRVEGYVHRHRDRRTENYDRLKQLAESAEFGERGEAWQRLLDEAVTESLDEFTYVLANALFWTGREHQTGSRIVEVCYRGAEAAASSIELQAVARRARYERHSATGHRLRSQHCFSPAISHFDAAVDVARADPVLTPWEAIRSRAIVDSHDSAEAGEYGDAIDVLSETIDTLLESGQSPERLNHGVRHLSGRKCELEARRAPDASARRSALEDARAHYDAIGFDRSAHRIADKLDTLRDPDSEDATEPESKPQASHSSDPHPLDSDPGYSAVEHHTWLEGTNRIDSPSDVAAEELDTLDTRDHSSENPAGNDDPYIF